MDKLLSREYFPVKIALIASLCFVGLVLSVFHNHLSFVFLGPVFFLQALCFVGARFDTSRRFSYQAFFFVSIVIVPIAVSGIDNLWNLCAGWLVAFLICSIINRLIDDEPKKSTSDGLWLKIGFGSVIKDVLKFRSEFSINRPAGHRDAIENMYSHIVLCLSFVVLSPLIIGTKFADSSQQGQISLYSALSAFDSSLLVKILDNHDDVSKPSFFNVMLHRQQKEDAPAPMHYAEIFCGDRDSSALKSKSLPSRDIANVPDPNVQVPRPRSDIGLDLIIFRNLLFVGLVVGSLYIVSRNSSDRSYVNKWNHISELQQEIFTSANPKATKLLFLSRVLVTEMWGHRSFAFQFEKILSEFRIPVVDAEGKKLKVSDILEDINKQLAELSVPDVYESHLDSPSA